LPSRAIRTRAVFVASGPMLGGLGLVAGLAFAKVRLLLLDHLARGLANGRGLFGAPGRVEPDGDDRADERTGDHRDGGDEAPVGAGPTEGDRDHVVTSAA
jgi:hypothetical protein